jgi:hypothetical protein
MARFRPNQIYVATSKSNGREKINTLRPPSAAFGKKTGNAKAAFVLARGLE